MASEAAVNTARNFCGAALYDANAAHARADVKDAPATDEGLRLLAANGNWSEVLSLAEKLDAHVVSKARRHPGKYAIVPLSAPAVASGIDRAMAERPADALHSASPATGNVGTSTYSQPECSLVTTIASPLSADAAVRNARLPYVLVQVTANLKMRRIVAAKKVIDELGDVEGEGFRHPVTRDSFAPFSLRLISAFLPLYVGAPMEAQKKLYSLLEECLVRERRCGAAMERTRAMGSSPDQQAVLESVKRVWRLWTRRVLRVQRALLHVHIHLNQQSLAHCVLEQVLRNEDVWHKVFEDLSDDLYQLRHVLLLQQVFCLSLHVGDAQKAREVHETIRRATTSIQPTCESSTAAAALSNTALSGLVATLCDAFLAVFGGAFEEAVRSFREVVERCEKAKETAKASDASGSSSGEGLVSAADGSVSEYTLRQWVLQGICANAQVSQATCMAYCGDVEPAKTMDNLCATMERHLKAEPHVLCNSDPFVESMVRFYTLAGERRANLERLSDVLEVFRCDRGSLPNLEALV